MTIGNVDADDDRLAGGLRRQVGAQPGQLAALHCAVNGLVVLDAGDGFVAVEHDAVDRAPIERVIGRAEERLEVVAGIRFREHHLVVARPVAHGHRRQFQAVDVVLARVPLEADVALGPEKAGGGCSALISRRLAWNLAMPTFALSRCMSVMKTKSNRVGCSTRRSAKSARPAAAACFRARRTHRSRIRRAW